MIKYFFLNCEKLLNWKMRNAKIGKNYQKKTFIKICCFSSKAAQKFFVF